MTTVNLRDWQRYVPRQQQEHNYDHSGNGALYGDWSHAIRQEGDDTRTRSRPVGSARSLILPHSQEAGKSILPDLADDRHLDGTATKTFTGDPYYIGDIYEQSQIRLKLSKPLDNKGRTSTPYLAHIDRLTDNGWPQLRYLADWMRVTTAPPKWKFLGEQDKNERASRVKVALLEFHANSATRHDISTTAQLAALSSDSSTENKRLVSRLFVVEDLSCDVIETLGSNLDVDPMVFRGHISDYTWYNTRDPWIELPDIDLVSRNRSFFHVRYAHTRYFRSRRSYGLARLEAGGFNVLRRVNREGNWAPGADIPDSDVGMVRSSMSFWVQPRKAKKTDPATGILLVDPSITEGFPLWGDYNDFAPCPSIAHDLPQRPPRGSTFDNIMYWLQYMSVPDIESIARDPRMLFQQPLSVLEWEVEDPNLRNRQVDLSATVDKLHSWRRRLPIYKTIVSEVLSKVIRRDQFVHATANSLLLLEKDFEIILEDLNNFHDRAERIMSVVTAVMAIEESKKALEHDRSLARLTYLAVIFVPLSFVSSFFAMSDDITKLTQTFWIYFAVAIPMTLLSLAVVRFSDTVFDIPRRIMRRFRRKKIRYSD
ncbi:MAG: hypothetical protein Q9172_004804 [Xanthocarpia lactea]